MKRKMMFLCMLAMLSLFAGIAAGAYNIGDVIGYAQPTDIVASINGYQLMSYNVDGYTYICAEDLRHYGMDVRYDNDTRSLSVARNTWTMQIDPQSTNPAFWEIGSRKERKKILYTDIVTYVDGNYVNSCNINGTTIIQFDTLSAFGVVFYDNTKREISLTIPNLAWNPVDVLVDAINQEAGTSMKQAMEPQAKKLYGNHVTCDVFLRAKGSLMVFEIYLNGVVLNSLQKRAEQQLLEDGKYALKSGYQEVKRTYPELAGIALILYDGSRTQAAGITIELD